MIDVLRWRELMPSATRDWKHWPSDGPAWLDGYVHLLDPDYSRQRLPPRGIVIHSGDKSDRVAESALNDGRDVSYHFAWSREHGKIVQLVALNCRAWHAGSEGNHWLGIALSGPWGQNPRSDVERGEFRACVASCVAAFGGYLRWWCRHSDITRGKKDPGPGFLEEWMEGTGLSWRKAS